MGKGSWSSYFGISYVEVAYPQDSMVGILYVEHIQRNENGCAEMFVLVNLFQYYKVIYSELCRHFEIS